MLYYKTDGTVVFQFQASIYFVSMDSMIQSESSILYSFPQKGQILLLYASKLAPHESHWSFLIEKSRLVLVDKFLAIYAKLKFGISRSYHYSFAVFFEK